MKRHLVHLLLIVSCVNTIFAGVQIQQPTSKHDAAFAVIIDDKTYQKVSAEIRAYQAALEQDQLSTYLLIHSWKNPTEIREQIIRLRKQDGRLEGVVFIGDIPIPMIRDAQHLSSAFKIDQQGSYSWQKTSVPSDRFYEDFDLKFTFLKQDEENPLLFYYSLNAQSAQTIDKEIYSARMLPPVNDSTRYNLIRQYLNKVIDFKQHQQRLSHALFFTGHGYHSESLNAWAGEILGLREQFPQLFSHGRSLKTFYHSTDADLKMRLLNELQTEFLDLVVFHAHGGVDAQYILGNPPTVTIASQIEAVKLFIRNKLRAAKRKNNPIAEVKLDYMERYGVPLNWFDNAFDEAVMRQDSLFASKMDIYAEDVRKIAPQASLIIFDECFNGAFFQSRYIAGEYVFGSGSTVAAIANSVNVIQDIWANEFLGLLGFGLRLGQIHRLNTNLESHIIGDPTTCYQNDFSEYANILLSINEERLAECQDLLCSVHVPLRNLAVHQLAKTHSKNFEEQLIQIYETDPSFIVRTQAFKAIARQRSAAFETLLLKSIHDPYEFIRRKTVTLMGDVGESQFIAPLILSIASDPSRRVVFNARTALSKIEIQSQHVEAISSELSSVISVDMIQEILSNYAYSKAEWAKQELIPNILNDSLSVKKRIAAVRYFRNFRYHAAVDTLLDIVMSSEIGDDIRVALIEALGWFSYSKKREQIITTCAQLAKRKGYSKTVYTEAEKTKQRLLAGANNPLTP
ncbi:MAG TPA: HEAT repeat domain-containing protein [bacterium]|nr:HEAT repeat domain-containing protein [bacterium]